jgi:WD40 repeat protein
VARDSEKAVRLYDLASGEQELTFADLPAFPRRVAFSHDGRRLAIGLEGGAVLVHRVAKRSVPLTFQRLDGQVTQLAFSADGKRLLSAVKGRVAEWDLTAGRLPLPGNWDHVYGTDPVFSPDGSRLAAAWSVLLDFTRSSVGSLLMWDAETGKELVWPQLPASTLDTLHWSPDGSRLAVGGRHEAGLPSFRLPLPAEGAGGLATALLLPQQQFFTFRLFDKEGREGPVLRTGNAIHHRAMPLVMLFGPDGCLLLGSDPKGWVLWDAVSGRQHLAGPAPTGNLSHAAFSPDGQLLALAGEPTDAANGARPGGIPPSEVHVWDVQAGRLAARMPLPPGALRVTGLSFRPDGRSLLALLQSVSGGNEVAMELYCWETGRWQGEGLLRQVCENAGEGQWLVAFSADGRYLAVGHGPTVWVCESATGRLIHALAGHRGGVQQVWFGADGTRLFAVSSSAVEGHQELRIWAVEGGQELLNVRQPLTGLGVGMRPGLGRRGDKVLIVTWGQSGEGALVTLDGSPGADVPQP